MEVFFEKSEYDIPKIEEEIVLVLAKFEDFELTNPEVRRSIARALHLKLSNKEYINREVVYEKK